MVSDKTADQILEDAKELINRMSEDEALWFVAECITEKYLQRALRKLMHVIEQDKEVTLSWP